MPDKAIQPGAIRPAREDDIDLIIEVETADWMHRSLPVVIDSDKRARMRSGIAGFLRNCENGAWILEDPGTGERLGLIMCRFRDRHCPDQVEAVAKLLAAIGDDWLGGEGRFGEIYQTWVAPAHRRRGYATLLKRHLETQATARDTDIILTHAEVANMPSIALNLKLGYREICRGTIWDDVVRVSLVKRIG